MKVAIFFAIFFAILYKWRAPKANGGGIPVTTRYSPSLPPSTSTYRKEVRWCKHIMPRVLSRAMKVFTKLGLNKRNRCTCDSVRGNLLLKLRSNCESIDCEKYRSVRRCVAKHAKTQRKYIKNACMLARGQAKPACPGSYTAAPTPSPTASTSKAGYLYTSKGSSSYGAYPPSCTDTEGQTCSAYCPTGATELPRTAFSCPSGHTCCKAAVCEETCDAECAEGATELKDYFCTSGQKCCQAPSCGSVESQRCYASVCPYGTEEQKGFKCSTSGTNKCCKLPNCADKAGQSCESSCADGLDPVPNFFCKDDGKCCPSPSPSPTSSGTASVSPTATSSASVTATASASITPTATSSASISVSPSTTAAAACGTVDGQKCFPDGKCPDSASALNARQFSCAYSDGGGVCCQLAECTSVYGQTCSKNGGCPYDVAPLDDFNCDGSDVCCPVPSPSPSSSTSPSSSASITPTASVSFTASPSLTPTTSASPSTSGAVACGTKDGQKCFSDGKCPNTATELEDSQFSCAYSDGGGVCCQLAECTSVYGQTCAYTSCPYDVSPLDDFNCEGSQVCCPVPSASPSSSTSATASISASATASITPSASVSLSASPSLTPTTSASPSTSSPAACGSIDGQKCFLDGKCPDTATALEDRQFSCAYSDGGGVCCQLAECTSFYGQTCSKTGECAYGVAPLDDFNCDGSDVCCPVPSPSPSSSTSPSSSASITPTASVSVTASPSITSSTSATPSTSAAAVCGTEDGQKCFSDGNCPDTATALDERQFSCAIKDGGVCCQLASCTSVYGQTCAESSCEYGVSALPDFNCPEDKVCCPAPGASPSSSISPSSSASSSPSSSPTASPTLSASPSTTSAAACSSGERQTCRTTELCPDGAALVSTSDFTCDGEGGGICCKLQSCAAVYGQSCQVGSCAYGTEPLPDFYCPSSENCCPEPIASPTSSASASASATASISVAPTPTPSSSASSTSSPSPSKSTVVAVQTEPCPEDDEHKCAVACFDGYVLANQYVCSYGSCCVKPEEYVDASSGGAPYATTTSTPAPTSESTPEESLESEESTPEASAEAPVDGCEDYGGLCETTCGDGSEEDPSTQCKDNKKCCFPIESQKCEGDLLKCIPGTQSCSGIFVDDLEGCADGQRCCESDPCTTDYKGTCKEKCGDGEAENGECEVAGGKCCVSA